MKRSIVGFLLSGALAACGGAGSPEPTGSDEQAITRAPTVPAAIAVPDGNRLAFYFDAIGVQIYACSATATGYAWTFVAPEANLFDKHGHVVVTHFAGPTWQARDGSTVVGAKIAGVTPDPTAIPWLLLGAASHTGDGRMSDVTYIQRLFTAGGLAPATGCDATSVGQTRRVDYTATYYFYEAKEPDCH